MTPPFRATTTKAKSFLYKGTWLAAAWQAAGAFCGTHTISSPNQLLTLRATRGAGTCVGGKSIADCIPTRCRTYPTGTRGLAHTRGRRRFPLRWLPLRDMATGALCRRGFQARSMRCGSLNSSGQCRFQHKIICRGAGKTQDEWQNSISGVRVSRQSCPYYPPTFPLKLHLNSVSDEQGKAEGGGREGLELGRGRGWNLVPGQFLRSRLFST